MISLPNMDNIAISLNDIVRMCTCTYVRVCQPRVLYSIDTLAYSSYYSTIAHSPAEHGPVLECCANGAHHSYLYGLLQFVALVGLWE